MYSNKFAAKLMNIRRLCKENVRNLSIFMVLSTHYPTFRIKNGTPRPFYYRIRSLRLSKRKVMLALTFPSVSRLDLCQGCLPASCF